MSEEDTLKKRRKLDVDMVDNDVDNDFDDDLDFGSQEKFIDLQEEQSHHENSKTILH